jgi:putative redox protein
MMEAKTVWTDKDRFLGEADTGHALVIDAGSIKTACSPLELVLIGLCGCTASDVVSILRKKREPFTGLEVLARAERASEHPKVFANIVLVYRVRGMVTHKAMEDAVRLSKDKYCSVSAMLGKMATIDFAVEYID